MLTAIIFIIVLSVLVLVHEFGHFITAKRGGMKVEEFGLGFPPRLWSIKKGETKYSINLIPFGGFVKILGEDGEDPDNPRSFSSKSAKRRALIISAGVLMNVLLAFVLLSLGNVFGLRVGLTGDDFNKAKDIKIQIIQVIPASPADISGLQILDEIVGFKYQGTEQTVQSVEEVQQYINEHKGRQIVLKINRNNEIIEKELIPRVNPPEGEGASGISLAATGVLRYPWYESVYRGAQNTFYLVINTAIGYYTVIKSLFVSGSPGVELTGPIGIARITGQAARIGFNYLMQLTAIISVNLAILNIIPFPALDGGRLLFIIIEKIRRKTISKKVEGLVNTVGFGLLILLMIYVTTKDVIKLF